MKHTIRALALVISLFACAAIASAQFASAYFAGGTATDSSAGPINLLGAGVSQSPSMGGFFKTVGADFTFFHHVGVGIEMSSLNGRSPYAGLEYHPAFYDANAVYEPVMFAGRFSPEIQGGYGEAMLDFYDTPQICYKLPQGCGAANGEAFSVNDGEVHFAGGLRFYVYRGLFVRPQVDVRRVGNNFSSYFGSSWIPEYTVGIGYTINWKRLKSLKK